MNYLSARDPAEGVKHIVYRVEMLGYLSEKLQSWDFAVTAERVTGLGIMEAFLVQERALTEFLLGWQRIDDVHLAEIGTAPRWSLTPRESATLQDMWRETATWLSYVNWDRATRQSQLWDFRVGATLILAALSRWCEGANGDSEDANPRRLLRAAVDDAMTRVREATGAGEPHE